MADTKFNFNFGAMYNFGNFDFGSFDASINPGRDLAGLDPLKADQYFGRGFTAYPYFDYSFGRNPNLRGIIGIGYMRSWMSTDPKKVATQLRSQEVELNEDALDALGGGSNDNNNDADTLSTNRKQNVKVHANHISQNIHTRLGIRTLNDRLVAAALFGFGKNVYDDGDTATFKDDAKAELMGIDRQGNPTPRNGADILLQTIKLKSAGLHVAFFPDKLSTDSSKKWILSAGISAGYMADWGGTTESINQDTFKKSADDPFRTPGFTHHKGLLGFNVSFGPNGSRTEPVTTDPLPPVADIPESAAPAVDNDKDGEGLTDDQERKGEVVIDGVTYTFPKTKVNDRDSDDDGLSDYDEVVVYKTNPRDDDSDDDDLTDGQEVSLAQQYAESSGTDFATVWDFDGDGNNNANDSDSDNDGKDDQTEYTLETFHPNNDGDGTPMYYDIDSDNDTLLDKKEYADEEAYPIEDGDSIPAVVDTDSDDDFINDGDDTGVQSDGRPNYLHAKASGITVTSERVNLTDKIYFETNSDRIQERSYDLLNDVAQAIRQNESQIRTTGHVEIQGHTDKRGTEKDNLDLSDRRAKSVKRYLLARGVPSDLLEAKGYGETQLIDTANTRAAHDQNRRVEFHIKDENGVVKSDSDFTFAATESITLPIQDVSNSNEKVEYFFDLPESIKGDFREIRYQSPELTDTFPARPDKTSLLFEGVVLSTDKRSVTVYTKMIQKDVGRDGKNPADFQFTLILKDGDDNYRLVVDTQLNQTEPTKKGSGGSSTAGGGNNSPSATESERD